MFVVLTLFVVSMSMDFRYIIGSEDIQNARSQQFSIIQIIHTLDFTIRSAIIKTKQTEH